MKANGLYCLVAEPKVGKSFLALQLANSLINNKQFLGFNTNPTSVLYVSTEISEIYNGRFVIIEIMCGIDYGYETDINNYSDVVKNMFDKYRELATKYNLTFLLIHHLNKEGKTLGSTGIDGNMNGILTLINNKDNTYTLKIVNYFMIIIKYIMKMIYIFLLEIRH